MSELVGKVAADYARQIGIAPAVNPGPSPGMDVDMRQVEQDRDEGWVRSVPRRFRDATLESVDEFVRKQLHGWLLTANEPENDRLPRTNLVIAGPVGVGKTWAAFAIARYAHRFHMSSTFAPVVDLLDAMRPDGDKQLAAQAESAPILILDDLGTEKHTDWVHERMFALINRRCLGQLPIIATCNLKPDQDAGQPGALVDAIGQRMHSRLLEDATVVTIRGVDRRRQ